MLGKSCDIGTEDSGEAGYLDSRFIYHHCGCPLPNASINWPASPSLTWPKIRKYDESRVTLATFRAVFKVRIFERTGFQTWPACEYRAVPVWYKRIRGQVPRLTPRAGQSIRGNIVIIFRKSAQHLWIGIQPGAKGFKNHTIWLSYV